MRGGKKTALALMKPGGAELPLMDWEELAGSCTTPWGEIRQRLEACEKKKERDARERERGSGGTHCCRSVQMQF